MNRAGTMLVAEAPNQKWSMDFVMDRLKTGDTSGC